MIDPKDPTFVAWATTLAGAALLAAPARATSPMGVRKRDLPTMRAIGAADLVLVPGLLRGEPRWAWMAARAALDVAQAATLLRLAPRTGSPGMTRAAAAGLAALTVADASSARDLRRAQAESA